MRVRIRNGLRATARRAMTWAVHRLEDLAVTLVRQLTHRRPAPPPAVRPPEHADERTARRLAEQEHGGVSSAQSVARWEKGDNPGGTHRKAVRHEGPERPRPSQEEPQERKERVPGGEKHLPANRRRG
jgi:hypothetical protein